MNMSQESSSVWNFHCSGLPRVKVIGDMARRGGDGAGFARDKNS